MPHTNTTTLITPARDRVVVMGVSGCGKSTLAHAISEHLEWTMVEGDTFHSVQSQAKMAQGIALTDDDRAQWLQTLAWMIERAESPTVVTCSALKASYRDILRAAAPGKVAFVYMALSQEESFKRVSRRQGHTFPASLVASQFAALEAPRNEPDVLTVDATTTTEAQLAEVARWLGQPAVHDQ